MQFLNLFIDTSTLFLTIHVYGMITFRFLFRRVMGNYLQIFIYFPDLRNVYMHIEHYHCPFCFSGVSPGCLRFICKHLYTGEIGNFAFQIWKMYTLNIPLSHLFFVVCPLAAFVLMISNISMIINQIMKLKRLQNFIDTILLINTWKCSEVKIVSNNDKT